MGEIETFLNFWMAYGSIAVMALIVLAFAGVWFTAKWLRKTVGHFDRGMGILNGLIEAHTDKQGHIIKLYEYNSNYLKVLTELETLTRTHFSEANRHYEDVKKLANDEHWKNCPIDKCPNFPKILLGYQGLISKFEIFQINAIEVRENMLRSMEEMAASLSRLTEEASNTNLEIIALLRTFREESLHHERVS